MTQFDTPGLMPLPSMTPPLELRGDEHNDIGRLPVGELATRDRTVTNTTKHRLTSKVLRSSCPCVTVLCQPPNLEPGASGSIRISTPVAPIAEPQRHWAVIEYSARNDQQEVITSERVMISVGYQADLRLIVEPQRIWMTAVAGEPAERTVYLRSSALDALNIHDIRTDSESVLISSTRRFPVQADDRPGEEALALTISASVSTTGLLEANLLFRTDDPTIPEGRIQVAVKTVDRWIAESAGFIYLFSHLDEAQSKTIRVRSRHRDDASVADLRVRLEGGVDADARAFRASLIHQGTDSVLVTLVLKADLLAANEGLAQVELLDTNGQTLSALPVAWIKPLPRP
ncbi:MAG: hypothetical protein AB7O77_07330 [Phycisphaerales bacterium]